jgi:putative Mg2+ transporter-C (MgtC) family protein
MVGIWLQEAFAGLREDFSDLPDVAHATRIAVRLLLAALLGGLLGYQRGQAGKEAGLRTYMLVSLGAALFIVIPQQAHMTVADLSRVIQGLITGVGFLGAGAILKLSEQAHIKGLTTAAGIWLASAVGLAAGMGREATAILGTLLALIILALLPRLERSIGRGTPGQESPPSPSASGGTAKGP